MHNPSMNRLHPTQCCAINYFLSGDRKNIDKEELGAPYVRISTGTL